MFGTYSCHQYHQLSSYLWHDSVGLVYLCHLLYRHSPRVYRLVAASAYHSISGQKNALREGPYQKIDSSIAIDQSYRPRLHHIGHRGYQCPIHR